MMELQHIAFAIIVAVFAYSFRRALSKVKLSVYTAALIAAGDVPKEAKIRQYTDVFPPSQRHTLVKVLLSGKDHGYSSPIHDFALLKIDSDYRLATTSTRIYSGFTVGDVRTLGCFPDYAILSGVPAPKPLQNFNIDAARPRPYRPFRWPYHQTMCKELNGLKQANNQVANRNVNSVSSQQARS